jgi:hypothetical protein
VSCAGGVVADLVENVFYKGQEVAVALLGHAGGGGYGCWHLGHLLRNLGLEEEQDDRAEVEGVGRAHEPGDEPGDADADDFVANSPGLVVGPRGGRGKGSRLKVEWTAWMASGWSGGRWRNAGLV